MKVIVFVYDGYKQVIPYFIHFYYKHWHDNPYETVFVTEDMDIPDVTVFKTGKLPWGSRMIKYLKLLHEDNFLLLLDDYIIDTPINTNAIQEAEILCRNDVGCVRLHPHNHLKPHLRDVNIPGYKEYPLDKPYGISLMSSIWQKDFFLEFVREGENIWQTETEGSKRIVGSNKRVLWVDSPIIHHHPYGYMHKGKIVPAVVKYVKENW